jgi:hypothetical protein
MAGLAFNRPVSILALRQSFIGMSPVWPIRLLAGHPRITLGQAAWGAGGCPHQPVRRWSGLRASR